METLDDFSVETLDRALHEALAPVEAQIRKLDETIAAHEQRLSELREVRKRARAVRHLIDPSTKPGPKSNGRPGHLPAMQALAQQQDTTKLRRLTEYVRAHPGEDLIANAIEPHLKGVSNSKVKQLMEELSDRGIIRFDRITKGGGKAYRLV